MPRDHEYESGHKTPREKQQRVLKALAAAGAEGVTPREMAMIEQPGEVSSLSTWNPCFTHLHQDKAIVALRTKRDGSRIYVLKEYALGRETWPGYHHKAKTVVIVRQVIKHCETCTCEEE